jgi:hypothetical protein
MPRLGSPMVGGRLLTRVQLGVASACVLLAVALPASASASEKVPLITHFHAGIAVPAPDLNCPTLESALATLALRVQTTYGLEPGDTLVGTGVASLCAYPMPDGTLSHFGEEVFTGTLEGCGTGSFTGGFEGAAVPDPATGVVTDVISWHSIKDSGTGDLEDIKGEAHVEGIVSPLLEEDGAWDGEAKC